MATPKKAAHPHTATELLDLIPKLQAMPGEDKALMADLRQALLLDLAPSTPYQHSIAEQIFSLEWEAARHRRMRDALIRAEIRKQSVGVFHMGKVGQLRFSESNKAAISLGFDLVSDDPKRQNTALQKLADQEITPDEVLAKAYKAVAKSVEPHQAHIAEIERRRRRLRDDFDKLKVSAAKPVEDAVLLDNT